VCSVDFVRERPLSPNPALFRYQEYAVIAGEPIFMCGERVMNKRDQTRCEMEVAEVLRLGQVVKTLMKDHNLSALDAIMYLKIATISVGLRPDRD